jgi:uncharacterized protein YggE
MSRLPATILLLLFCGITTVAHAQQTAMQTSGAVVVLPAFGEVKHRNDEAVATFMIEEQHKDKTVAASRVNQKMKQGMEIIKREDTQASLETRGYYTYPVYAEENVQPLQNGGRKTRELVGWRAGQYLEVTTENLTALPTTVAAAQSVLALNGLHFGLSETTQKKLEEQRVAAAYRNLTDQIAAIAKAMGRRVSDVTLDTVDFEGTGAYGPQQEAYEHRTMSAMAKGRPQVEEPSFEPGETTLSTRVVGKIRFK